MAMTEEELRAAIAARKVELDKLEKGLYPSNIFDRCYVVTPSISSAQATAVVVRPATPSDADVYPFTYTERSLGNTQVSASVTVEKETTFYCLGIQFTLLRAGEVASQSVKWSIPAKYRLLSTASGNPLESNGIFKWRVRDTGQDREWQNDWLPSVLLASGDELPFFGLRAHAVLSGGSRIQVDVMPLDQTVYEYQFAFYGVERRKESA